MLDSTLRPFVDRALGPPARLLVRLGVTANMVTWVGFAIGMGAAAAIAAGWFAAGIVMILVNRICDGLDGAVARASQPSDAGGFLDITLDFIFYSAVPFGLALADPGHALAAAFLIFSFVGTGSSFLAYAIIAQKRGISTEARGKKGFFYLGGLTEGGETIIFLVIVVLFPQVFVPLAWVFGLLCWITTGTRVWSAIMQFSDG
ncbi:MAG TPA: CDP-alcohol phosphatidyltransferase [Alphaproteobacteria bacterium]|nr:CDP-alcohol phosphatidyltransferase [Alphaproteobacteria bacterium]